MVSCLICDQPMRADGSRNYRRTTFWFWCDDCQFGQVDPMPSAEEMDEYYASGEYRRETHDHRDTGVEFDGEPAEWNYHEEEERGKGWLDYIDSPQTHLDVGASTGKVLEIIGASDQVGIEPSPWGKRFPHYSRMDDVVSNYDLITCLHTLEHVVDPLELLRQIARVATGQVCIEVPQPVMRQWPHLTDWREKSLLRGMDLVGLRAKIVENQYHIKAKCELE